jgi:hypothetical protein
LTLIINTFILTQEVKLRNNKNITTETQSMTPNPNAVAGKNVLMVGLDPALINFSDPVFAAFPGLNAAKIMAGAAADRERLEAMGYNAGICLIDFGETAEAVVLAQLKQKQFDCVMIGAGVRVIPTHLILFEKLINLVHEHAPHARFCFNTKPTDTAEAVRRWI